MHKKNILTANGQDLDIIKLFDASSAETWGAQHHGLCFVGVGNALSGRDYQAIKVLYLIEIISVTKIQREECLYLLYADIIQQHCLK